MIKFESKNKISTWQPNRQWIFLSVVVLGVWIWLSGIGGYAFQNWDHHWRNAVFRDLITYKWPVVYPSDVTINSDSSSVTMLTYYIGFWLPAAFVGKIVGWETANAILFLWSWIGIILVGFLLQKKLNNGSLVPILLLVFFSGLDIIGMGLRQRIAPLDYFSFWPPIHRLENWTTLIQFSSNTTQLYWVYNQAIPSWLSILLILQRRKFPYHMFLWCLFFFYAPLQAIGTLPFILILMFTDSVKKLLNGEMPNWLDFKNAIKSQVNAPNLLGGGSILLISYMYFSQSELRLTGQLTQSNFLLFFLFIILEWGSLFLLISPKKLNPQWLVLGILLFAFAFFHTDTYDFGEKISAPILFILMIYIGKFILKENNKKIVRSIVIILLIIGSFTPIYEISRSVIKTSQYYFLNPNPCMRWENDLSATYPIMGKETTIDNALFHPHSLVADGIKSIVTVEEARWTSNYLGDATESIFGSYIAKQNSD
jgi:hypothetical protein